MHIKCVVAPAYVQLFNPHTTMFYLKSSNILSSSSKEPEPLSSHYTTKSLFSPLHTRMHARTQTHSHTHTHVTKHCVYRRGNRVKIYSLMNRGKSVKAINNQICTPIITCNCTISIELCNSGTVGFYKF